MSSTLRSPRGRRGAVSTLVALLAVLILAFVAVEAIWLAVHKKTWLFTARSLTDYLHRTLLDSTTVLVVAIVVAVVGLLLIVAALVPPRRRVVELADGSDQIATDLDKSSLRRTLADAAVRVDGISRARVKTRRRRVKVKVITELRHDDGLADRVEAAVTQRLTELAPRRPLSVRVHLDRKDS